MEYKDYFEIMGKERNSYSKTDSEATFMRMKDDHMRNGQLKAVYNAQIAVENYFIIHGYVSNDRTDDNALIPVVQKHIKAFDEGLKELTADSGYCSEKNLLFLKELECWEELKEKSHANIQREKGILNRQIRSIQTEGHFGNIKENDDFRRFNHRSTEKVYKEFMLYAIGRI